MGTPELLLILVIVLLLFGATRLPKLAKSLGESKRELERTHGDTKPPAPDADPPTADPPTR
jgi:sec-independent protein translocase protein TatA